MKSIFTFLGTFVLGALIALGARTALHEPHAGHDTAGSVTTRGDYAPMVNNSPPPAPAPVPHSSHAATAPAPATAPASGTPVNSICAICGMKVDPSLPTAEYQGKVIGFGCKMCAPKFKAEPEKYGPSYLRNEIIKR